MKRFALLLFLLPSIALAQTQSSPVFRNVSGTAANPGPVPYNAITWNSGGWSGILGGAAFASHVTVTGDNPGNAETFSTNWLMLGLGRSVGSRGFFLLRARGSAEPFTVPEEGYPQLLQVVPQESGGPLVDRMRAQNAVGEAAVDLGVRVGAEGFAHVYAGPVGDPALGPVPFAQRASSEEFVEAPYSYAIQESFHEASRVVTAGLGSRSAAIEGSVFHHMVTTGRHSSIDDGPIDSWSARLTVNPTPNTSLQYSRGKLGDEKRPVSSASLSYGNGGFATSIIWTKREMIDSCYTQVCLAVVPAPRDRSSIAFETTVRPGGPLTFMLRGEYMDNLLATALAIDPLEKRTHVTLGAIYDLVRPRAFRGGVGVNIDYHTNVYELTPHYGHKPQTIYIFARLRTNRAR